MFPAPFEYLRPGSLGEAVGLLKARKGEAKLLAGGHSLLPLLKLRLSTPACLIDLGRIPGLAEIREADGGLRIGAMTTHHSIESSPLVGRRWTALAESAAAIGDVQVRNRGTLGGSLAHADPAADYPAPILACEAEVRILGPGGERMVAAGEFFRDLMTTALREDEVITEIKLPGPPPGSGSAYVKFPHPASRFAVVGVAAVLTVEKGTIRRARVGVTGATAAARRASATEAALEGGPLSAERLQAAADRAADGLECLGDLVASPEYRAHLVRVLARRALQVSASRATGG
jgi:carbon-monoxide dehydrogenase medium subunit